MKYAFIVLRYTLLRNARDVAATAEQILLPLVLIFVLGTVTGGAVETRDIGPTAVTYTIEGEGPYAEALQRFLEREEIGRYLSPTEASTPEEALRLLEAEEAVAAIILAADDVGNTDTPQVTLIEGPGHSLRAGVVRSLVDGFVRSVNVSEVLTRLGRDGVVYEPLPTSFDERVISKAGGAPDGMDFYAVSMLVLFVMYIAGYAVDGLREDLLEPTGERVRSTPVRGWEHIAGKLAAHVVTGVIQGAIIIVVSLVAFGTNWGTRPLALAALLVALCIFAVAFGGLVLALTRDGQQAQYITNYVILASMMLSGGAFRFNVESSWFGIVQRLLPHYQGQRAALAVIYGGGPGEIGPAFIYFLGGAAVLFTLTVMFSRRYA
ncbi:MAG: ABC transporter permease [Spirochaetales bacterium]|nr:ABC transporter permease [Spirochaetales bacterium]